MSPNFEQTLSRAAAAHDDLVRTKLKKARLDTEYAEMARSIIEPYLADSGPKIASVLRNHNLPTTTQYGYRLQPIKTDYWEFKYCSDKYEPSYSNRTVTLSTKGRFGGKGNKRRQAPYSCGLIVDQIIVWERVGDTIYANAEDRKVYINHSDSTSEPYFEELSVFVARRAYDLKRD